MKKLFRYLFTHTRDGTPCRTIAGKIKRLLRMVPGVAWLDDYTNTLLGFYAVLAVSALLWAVVVVEVIAPVFYWPGEATTNHPPHGDTEVKPSTPLNP